MSTTVGKRQRATRLSSGSVKQRSYVEEVSDGEDGSAEEAAGVESDSEEDFKPEKKVKGGRGSGRSSRTKQESPSSDEFEEEDDVLEDEEQDVGDDSEEEEEDSSHRTVKSIPKAKKEKKAVKFSNSDLNEGQEVIEVVKAPKGKAARGTISAHTLSFLAAMKDPDKNDRDWFAQHKNIYDFIYENWIEFVEASTEEMMEKVDDTIAWLPPKALVERIYRDVRFSNDKTPYKKHLSWCLSRMGRKGSFAKYYLTVSSGNSGFHAGMYEPSKDEIQSIRHNIVTNSAHGIALRNLVKDKEFCKQFGSPPKNGGKNGKQRTSFWGAEDELKRAPKDYQPDHPDIDWLKLKHFTVSHRFTDTEVLSSDFMEKVLEVARIAKPLVDVMNEILHGAGPAGPADEA